MTSKTLFAAAMLAAASMLLPIPLTTEAADHSEAPIADEHRTLDIADVYAFLDPTDNSKLVIGATLVGFIVPSENVNQGAFDSTGRFQFELEETGDATPDRIIDIRFSPRMSTTTPQTATITLMDGRTFTAPTTVPSLADAPPAFTVTTDATSGVAFFAGLTDDPFFFDIVGFNRTAASILSGSPDVSHLNRGRDSFAGYNVQTIAFSIPVAALNFSDDVVGVSFRAQLPNKLRFRNGHLEAMGRRFFNADRMGVPAINTVLIPFARKDEYNQAGPAQDAAGTFANDIVGTLTALGTDEAHINVLAGVAVTRGDMLRVNRTAANSGPNGGNNAGAGFPNGRRLGDDVIDTILFLVTNEGLTTGDHVNANDRSFGTAFPFFAPPHQPLPNGATDGTQNKA
jgi:hypothetical protein